MRHGGTLPSSLIFPFVSSRLLRVCLNPTPLLFQFFRKEESAEDVNMLFKSNVEKDDNILDYCDEACCDYLGFFFEQIGW